MKCLLAHAVFGLSFMITISGCGGDPQGRQRVSGTITYQGQLLERGRIEFTPLESQGTQSGAIIRDGVYSIPADQGLKPGKYKVRIYSTDKVLAPATGPPGDGPAPPQPKNPISSVYNTDSKLFADVAKGGKNVFDFAVD